MQRFVSVLLTFLLAALPCVAQQSSSIDGKLFIPAGTSFSVVLDQQVSSSATHIGNQLHTQLVSPVVSGSQVLVPAGTYLQGKVAKITQQSDRVTLDLSSATLAYANGYVVKLPGTVSVLSSEGWWRPAPNSRRALALLPFFAAPMVGAGIGAAVGKDPVLTPGSINGGQLTPGSMTPSTRGRDAAIGLGVGAAIAAVGLAIYASAHHHGGPDFFFPAGAPMDVLLDSSIALDPAQIAGALNQPQPPMLPTAQLPQPTPPSFDSTSSGLCPGPDIPGTPDIVIPGTPAIGDSPGTPDTVIPGMPATPGGMVPCN